MNIIKHITLIKNRIITKKKINKIVKYIKKSHINAYIIGKEIMQIYSLLFNIYKENDGNYDIDSNFYYYLINSKDFNKTYLFDIISKNILFSEFFTKLNIKIFKLKNEFIWYYLRGYFVNDLEFLVFHINKFNTSYCVIYDYHIHYITFIYEFLKKIYIQNIDMNLELNNSYDIYSLDNETNNTNYKLIINHQPHNFNNPILDLFELFYYNINNVNELTDDADIALYQKYNYFKYYL
jgi:hypothetical protein